MVGKRQRNDQDKKVRIKSSFLTSKGMQLHWFCCLFRDDELNKLALLGEWGIFVWIHIEFQTHHPIH